jgi:hypothetical protein
MRPVPVHWPTTDEAQRLTHSLMSTGRCPKNTTSVARHPEKTPSTSTVFGILLPKATQKQELERTQPGRRRLGDEAESASLFQIAREFAALALWSALESICKMHPPDNLPRISFSGLPLAQYAPCAFHSFAKHERVVQSAKLEQPGSFLPSRFPPVGWPSSECSCFQTNEAVLFMLVNPGKRLRQRLPADRPLPRHYFPEEPAQKLWGMALRQRGYGIKGATFFCPVFGLQTRST